MHRSYRDILPMALVLSSLGRSPATAAFMRHACAIDLVRKSLNVVFTCDPFDKFRLSVESTCDWRRCYSEDVAARRRWNGRRRDRPLRHSTWTVGDAVDNASWSFRPIKGPESDTTVPYFPIYYNDVYQVKLPPGHRFPMEKYRKVRELIQRSVGSLDESRQSRVRCDFRVSPLATLDELTTTHTPAYVERFLRGDLTKDEIRNVGFPWSPSGVDRALSSVGGTVAAASAVCEEIRQRRRNMQKEHIKEDEGNCDDRAPVWSAHVAGGTHHAFADRGEGFCVFSDIAVAANVLLQRYSDVVSRILVIDLDVHQGNGNAVLFDGRDDVVTFSMHCEANYFSDKQKSDVDVELPAGCTDETYLPTLRHWLNLIESEGGVYDLVFFQAGVDVLDHDRLGRMELSGRGVKRRNELVFDFARRKGVPLVITMGGGYPRDDWTPILDAHANVYLQAHQFLSDFRRK
mmetsp:Transcript_2046/g.5392  ORF Transcript_2046/g.5392 Transcript_2046/m.5392 type:complete len:460 (-) Transcript_2046:338-1717(-)